MVKTSIQWISNFQLSGLLSSIAERLKITSSVVCVVNAYTHRAIVALFFLSLSTIQLLLIALQHQASVTFPLLSRFPDVL
jgi:hypothetical protein